MRLTQTPKNQFSKKEKFSTKTLIFSGASRSVIAIQYDFVQRFAVSGRVLLRPVLRQIADCYYGHGSNSAED
jgi:hypothetical protein